MSDRAHTLSAARAHVEACAAALMAQPDDAGLRAAWGKGISHVLSFLYNETSPKNSPEKNAQEGNRQLVRELLAAFKSVAAKHPQDKDFCWLWADAVFSAVCIYGQAKNISMAREVLDTFLSDAEIYPAAGNVCVSWGETAGRMIRFYSSTGDFEAVWALQDHLWQAVEHHRDEPNLRYHWSLGVVNFVHDTEDVRGARMMWERIDKIAKANPEEVGLVKEWGKTLANMVGVYRGVDDIASARALVDAFELNLKGHPQEDIVRYYWAGALCSVSYYYGQGGDWDAAREALDVVKRCANAQDSDLFGRWAGSAFYTSIDMNKAGEMRAARALVDEIEQIVEEGRGDVHLWHTWAKAVSHFVPVHVAAGNLEAARALLDKLAVDAAALIDVLGLATRVGADYDEDADDNDPIAASYYDNWANAVFYMMHVYGEGGDLISAQALTDALAQTLEKYEPDCSRDIRLHWASALFFMGGFYAKAGAWEDARSTLARLEGFMGEHDDDLHVRQIWVEAVYQMGVLCAAAGKLGEARGLLNVLEVASQNTETRNRLNPDAQRADLLKAYLARGDLSLAWVFLQGLWEGHEALSEIEDVEPTTHELWLHAAGILVRCYDGAGEQEVARELRDDLEAAVLGALEDEA